MPRLKQLVLQGFKSFCDTTTVVFPTGITAVVGPNGSGKSNVSDGIRWVLGEQRIKSLRGRSGEDMIFAGSQRRPRAGMARVALTFDNTEGWLPLDYAEVTIERRSYRSGENEYWLNGSKVRLMDLNDVLNRSGLGRDAYLFIGQGLVDRVLSLTPQERVGLFEQAAGTAPYRVRREEALKRLDDTRRNVERVQDILGEIEPRLHRLEKSAAKVIQHAKLMEELKGLLRTWYGYRWGSAASALELARQRVTTHEAEVHRRQEAAAALVTRIGELRRQMGALRSELAERHREAGGRHAEAEGFQRELAVARERYRLLGEQREEGQANLVPLQTTLEAAGQEIAALQASLQERAAQLARERQLLEEAEATYRAFEVRRGELVRRQGAAQARALESRHRLADRQSRLEQQGERDGQLAKRIAELEQALATAADRRRAQQTTVEESRRLLAQIEETLRTLEAEEERLRAVQEAARAEGERLRRELGQKESQRQPLVARLDALERLHAEGAGLYAGVRAVLGAVTRRELQGLLGTVAELVRVPSELDRAIETALGAQLQNVIARRWEDAEAGIDWLKRTRAGRVTFLPLDNLRPGGVLTLPSGPGVIGVAAELVSFDPELRPAVLLLLGRTAVAQNLDAARRLFKGLSGGFQIVTLDGEILRSGGALTGGQERKDQDGGLLARERERRELPDQVAALEKEALALREAFRRSEEQFRKASEEVKALADRRRSAERERQEADRRLDQAVRALEKAGQEADWQRKLLEEAQVERERLQATRARLDAEIKEATAALEEAEAALNAVAAELSELADDGSARAVAECRTRVALAAQEHENRRLLLESRQKELRRLEEQIVAQQRRAEALGQELIDLEQKLTDLQARYETARSAADAFAAQIPPLEERVAGLEREQARWEQDEGEARRVLREAEQRTAQAQVEVRRREDDALSLRREIQETLGAVELPLPEALTTQQPLPMPEGVATLPVVMELPDGLEEQIAEVRAQIHRLEPINPAAQDEYNEVSERHGFLRTQIEDLETAAIHLRKVIEELDGMIETAFQTTFKGIAAEFSRIFVQLFNGGTAKLQLVSTSGEQAGVEITARPPGKRTAGLGMLSGGERTLTAVALLFAVLQVSPIPFCVLDEVDAALDEANVGRFRAMLRELSRQTQFIVITHNQGTVESADAIYGVSMGEDSVSQVLSLNLADLPVED